jgi:FkbM family methyltransferase
MCKKLNLEIMTDITNVNFVKKMPLNILKFRADKHDFGLDNGIGWEREYLEELYKHLNPGKIVFDIGAEEGEFSAFAAKVVGGENIHLFEPSKDYWPNIKRVWNINNLADPYCFEGFVSRETSWPLKLEGRGWPQSSKGEIFTGTNQICSYDGRFNDVPRLTLDVYCELFKVVPDVIMMDCEGAEVDIIIGGKSVLTNNNPVLFISVHSDAQINMYGRTKTELFVRLGNYGYKEHFISQDHEEHWKFTK